MTQKISELTEITSVGGTDYIEVSQDDGSGGYQTRRWAPGTAANADLTTDGGKVVVNNAQNNFSSPQKFPNYTVSGLPSAGDAGRIAFATDGLKDGESSGSGTGVLVYDDGSNWISCDNSSVVSA
ncbi:MAG: hypothetical protein V5A72_02590 [Candidatus Nanohaloarchaea archaeon]